MKIVQQKHDGIIVSESWEAPMATESAVLPRGYGTIAPALTSDLWEHQRRSARPDVQPCGCGGYGAAPIEAHLAAIAIANDALPSTDRRKLDWDYVDKLREIAQRLLDPREEPSTDVETALRDSADALALGTLSDILASYLPPRPEVSNG